MGVHLRKKTLNNGKISLYLDYYPPINKGDGSFTRREFLKKYLYAKPKDDDEKRSNKEILHFAKEVLLKREKEILYEIEGTFNPVNEKRDFLEYFKQLAQYRIQSKGNFNNWISALNYLTAFTGGICKMGDITEDFCNRFKNYLLTADMLKKSKGLKLSQNSALSYFNKFCTGVSTAFDSKYIKEDPLKHVKGIHQKETKREFLTTEELQKLSDTACELELLKTASLFSALTGLRWSDMKGLRWNDIQHTNDQGYFLHIIQQKTKQVILHPISNTAVQVLGESGSPQEEVFRGLKYSDGNNGKLKRWILKAGINKRITLHNFRHTYATVLLNNGADISTVQTMLGHKHIKTTMIYAKTLNEKKINAANLININL
ncbi:MAG: site-specific integrase [Bacteroidetes bacterium]|jgi:integrase|nr:MAG: site-specific integrase [Bacteroidota bacterium]